MIKARHTYTGKLVCDLFSGYKLNKAFRSIHFKGDNNTDNGLPVLMVANHFSWWDGFIQYRINRTSYKKRFHVMMLEEQLSKNMILNKGGAFSIRKSSRGMIHSLNYCIELLADKNNLVLLFPQGRIESMYTPYYRFETGLDFLLKHRLSDFRIVFNVNLVDYFSDKKPTLTVYYKNYLTADSVSLATMETDFNAYVRECKSQQFPPQ